MNYTAI